MTNTRDWRGPKHVEGYGVEREDSTAIADFANEFMDAWARCEFDVPVDSRDPRSLSDIASEYICNVDGFPFDHLMHAMGGGPRSQESGARVIETIATAWAIYMGEKFA